MPGISVTYLRVSPPGLGVCFDEALANVASLMCFSLLQTAVKKILVKV